jgi:putative flippase GtrA
MLADEQSTIALEGLVPVSRQPARGRHRAVRPDYAAAVGLAAAAPFILAASIAWGALVTCQPKLAGKISGHWRRFAMFGSIGAFVFAAGTAFQWVLLRPLGADGSYAAQSAFSIWLSYGLNRRLTWRDREAAFWPSFVKWNLQKAALTIPNVAGYMLLVRLGMDWLAANVAVTAVFTLVTYIGGDSWVFRRAAAPAAPHCPLPASWMPSVSVVIPCKGNQRTIGATADAILGQDYPNLAELILVGDVGDSTWQGVAHIEDPRLILLEHETTPGKRDPNVKRDKGLLKASGDVLALADSDIVMDRDWLTTAVGLLREQGTGLVAGGMRAIQ